MQIINDPKEMRAVSVQLKKSGKRIGLVPTMGALHEGHLSLIDHAKRESDVVVVSIYVNPAQFGIGEDYRSYPVDLDTDLKTAKGRGTDIVFCPTNEGIYPEGFETFVEVTALTKNLCGLSRPSHFRGVATVVNKLFNIVRPDVAVFGSKDYQQLKVIEKMVADLDMDVRIIASSIVREPDGLAMSSRNRYLNSDERKMAVSIYESLKGAEKMVKEGERDVNKIISFVKKDIEDTKIGRIDYVKICDPETLQGMSTLKLPALLAVAAYFGRARLIDNCILG